MKKNKEQTNTDLVAEVQKDFENRKAARRTHELQWQLNIDFLRGNQNNCITKFDTVVTMGKQFYWQGAEVFNHIAPMVEAKLGKLAAYKPIINVVPAGTEKTDTENAKLCKKIIQSVFSKNETAPIVFFCFAGACYSEGIGLRRSFKCIIQIAKMKIKI